MSMVRHGSACREHHKYAAFVTAMLTTDTETAVCTLYTYDNHIGTETNG